MLATRLARLLIAQALACALAATASAQTLGPKLAPLGQGTPGTSGVPTLLPEGLPIPGGELAFRVAEGPASGAGVLFYSPFELTTALPPYGGLAHVGLPLFAQPLSLDSLGASGPLLATDPVPAGLLGLELTLQAAVLDPLAQGGVSLTGGLSLRIQDAPPMLFAGESHLVFGDPVAVELGDLDGDGDLDLVAMSSESRFVSVRLGDPQTPFDTWGIYYVGNKASDIDLVDLDSDGALDVLITEDGGVSVLFGTGAGTLQPLTNILPTGPGPAASAGDLNADGILDLVVSDPVGNELEVLLGTGGGLFGPPSVQAASGPVHGQTLADFDQDGKLDLIVSKLGTVEFRAGLGNGSFGPPASFGTGETLTTPAYNPTVGDFDEDGSLDLAVANSKGIGVKSTVTVLRGGGDGTFTSTSVFPTGVSFARALAVADIDGDGHLDLVSQGFDAALGIAVRRGLGDGSFHAPDDYTTQQHTLDLVAGDLDGNGNLDVITCHFAEQVAVLRGRDGGGLSSMGLVPGTDATVIGSGDFDQDGIQDVAFSEPSDFAIGGTFPGYVNVAHGLGGGAFGAPAQYLAGMAASSGQVLDLNQDRLPDIVVLGLGGIHVLLGQSDGSLLQLPVTPTSGLAFVSGDFDGDGILDLQTSAWGSGGSSFLEGIGDGSFLPATASGVASDYLHLVTGDFNNDGMLDLIGSEGPGAWGGPGNAQYYQGLGSGTFLPAVALSAGSATGALAAGDFDGDGDLDVAIGDETTDDVRTLLGHGDGTFAPAKVQPLGVQPGAILAGDVDGNGTLDLLVASLEVSGILVLPGLGTGDYASPSLLGLRSTPSSLHLGDVDGDFAPDILAGPGYNGGLGIQLLPSRMFD